MRPTIPTQGIAEEALKLAALERLLDGEPIYPRGTVVRELQDERDRLRSRLDAA